MRVFKRRILSGVVIVSMISLCTAEAEQTVSSDKLAIMPTGVVHVIDWPANDQAPTKIRILKDTSHVFRFDREIVRAAVSNPAICDITTAGSKDILVNAKEAGIANLLLWDKDNGIASYQLEATLNGDKLLAILRNIDPTAEISAQSFNKSLSVYGTAETTAKVQQIADATKAFDAAALSFVKVKDPRQVLLEVRFAEVNRDVNKDFRFDWQHLGRYFGMSSFTGETGASTGDTDESYTQRGAHIPNSQDDAFEGVLPRALGTETIGNFAFPFISNSMRITNYLRFLEEKGILKLIARPNLLAKDGQEAEFRVGGEFPIPISNGNSGTSISYKEFGNSLKFTPEILEAGRIRLKVRAELSELDFSTQVTSGGVTVPGLSTRVESTTAELHDKETMVIAGIITQKITNSDGKVPYLGDIPIIGKPFTRNEFRREDVELIVVITPHIVKPFKLDDPRPMYDPAEVKDAIKILVPPFEEEQGDRIQKAMVQAEQRIEYDKKAASKKIAENRDVKPQRVSAPRSKQAFETVSEDPAPKKWTWPAPFRKEPAAAQSVPEDQPTITNFTSKISSY